MRLLRQARAGPPGRLLVRVLLLGLLLVVGVFVWLLSYSYSSSSPGQEIALDRVRQLAQEKRIHSAVLRDEDSEIVGRLCVVERGAGSPARGGGTGRQRAGSPAPRAGPCSGRLSSFYVRYPRSDVATQQLIEDLTGSGASVIVDNQNRKAVAKVLVSFVLPLLMLAGLFGLIFLARGAGPLADIAGFGTIRRRRKRRELSDTGVTFADVAGADEAVAELREVTDYLKAPEKFQAYGAAAPKGVLLYGPPGCGKTLLARAVAGESNVPFFSISGSEFVESLVGIGAARVRDLFRQVRDEAPAIVFIDELDAVGRRRGGDEATGGEREQTVNQLLVEMDGFELTSGIVLMAATNRPDILDPALLRPGRFDRHVMVESPDVVGRRKILELHARGKPIAPDVDFESLARRTSGFTGADLANVINEAALLALRAGEGTRIQGEHVGEAVLRVLHGPRRRGRLVRPEEQGRLAVHESGHAIVAAAFGEGERLQRVSIMARGISPGQHRLTEESERVLLTESEMEAELAVSMAGIAAEELVFGGPSTTSEDDIERATELAREMVGRYGMSAEVGRVRMFGNRDGYLPGESPVTEAVSSATLGEVDREVRRLVDEAEERAKTVLVQNRRELDRMAERLKEEETLEGAALDPLLDVVQDGGRPEAEATGSTRSSSPRGTM